MFLRTEVLVEKKLVGKSIRMSFAHIKTPELWREFMPRRKEIVNNIGQERYSAEVFSPGYFNNFDPAKEFDKWALVEVTDFDLVPAGMETLIFPEGLYAVFCIQGQPARGREHTSIFLGIGCRARDMLLITGLILQ